MNIAALIGIRDSGVSIMVLPVGNGRVINSPNSANPQGCDVELQNWGNADLAGILQWILGKSRDLMGSTLLGRRQSPNLSVRAEYERKSCTKVAHDRNCRWSQPYQPGERRGQDDHNSDLFQLNGEPDRSATYHIRNSDNPGGHRVDSSAPSESNLSRITSQIRGKLNRLFTDKLIPSQTCLIRQGGVETGRLAPYMGEGTVRPLVKARARLMLAQEGWASRTNCSIRVLVGPRKEITGGRVFAFSPLYP